MPQPRRPRRQRRPRRPRRPRQRQPGSEVSRRQLSRQRGVGELPGRLATTIVARVRCGTGTRASLERSPAGSQAARTPNGDIALLPSARVSVASPLAQGAPPHLRARPGLSSSPEGATRSASEHRKLRSSFLRQQAARGHGLEGVRRRVHHHTRVAAAVTL
eukprot:scaffold9737_cov72-Phaeocystis_antarctica.AAC.7